MRITKYPQSCLLIEENGQRILIDPGSFAFDKFQISDFGKVDAILITHSHFDHFQQDKIEEMISLGVPLYANKDVVNKFRNQNMEITKVEHEADFQAAGFDIKPVDIPHCKMTDGSDGPPNTGYIINNCFFHPGDGIELAGKSIEKAAIPIAGPTINYDKAWNLTKSISAKKVIPIHYSNPTFPANPNEFAAVKPENIELELIILEDGESKEI